MINRLWAWITGYVIIKMKGAQLEALINRIAGHGFGIWDLERVTANIMIGKIRIRQFKRLRPLLGGLNVRVGIVGRAGLPFFLAKLMKRNGLIVGLLLVIGCLYYLTGFVWVIEITGMEKLSADQIAAVLADQGIKVGAAKAQIRPNYLEKLLLTQFPELSWAGEPQRCADAGCSCGQASLILQKCSTATWWRPTAAWLRRWCPLGALRWCLRVVQ